MVWESNLDPMEEQLVFLLSCLSSPHIYVFLKDFVGGEDLLSMKRQCDLSS